VLWQRRRRRPPAPHPALASADFLTHADAVCIAPHAARDFLCCFAPLSLPMLAANVRAEVKALVTIAAPIILSFLLLMSIGLISVLNVGRIGENELAAVGFSVTFLNILGNSWIVGMTSALDTFGTQAFGAKNFVMFSNVMQRSLFLCMMTCIPLFGLFMFNEAILDAFHYDANVRNMAAPCAPLHPPPKRNAFVLQNCHISQVRARACDIPAPLRRVPGAVQISSDSGP
jgi:hypothetical protein